MYAVLINLLREALRPSSELERYMFYLTLGPLGREHFNCTSVGCIYLLTKALSIRKLIVTITKFSIMIGSSCENLSRNRRAITSVSNCSCIQFELFVIGYHVICTSIMCSLRLPLHCFLQFSKLMKKIAMLLVRRSSQKTFLILNLLEI